MAHDTWAGRVTRILPAAGLAILVLWVYSTGLRPGVTGGDSAELQYTAPLGGICHPPGYQTEVTLGGLFAAIPIGNDAAWRLNLLMALCGVAGCLAMYATVLRITGRWTAAGAAASLLAFSVVYWTYSLVAEAYVFYALFLLLGLYAAVRFVGSDRSAWLYIAVFLLGVGIGDRPSELPVLAGFAGLWYCRRKELTLDMRRAVLSLLLFVAPFAFSVASMVVRSDPQRLANRDDFLEERILAGGADRIRTGIDPAEPLGARISDAADYCLGAVWARDARGKITLSTAWDSFRKYVWLHSGAGAGGLGRYPGKEANPAPPGGTSIGPLGLLLAIAGTFAWRRRPEWLLVGWGFVLANLAFIVLYPRWDNLTFTVPSAVGWSLLAGLGAAGNPVGRKRSAWRLALGALAVAAPLFLLATNRPYADPRTDFEAAAIQWRARVAAAPWPERSAVLATYWPAMTLRYLFYVEADRADIHVFNADRADWPVLIERLNDEGHPVFIPREYARARDLPAFLHDTPAPLAAIGFVRVLEVPAD